MIQNDFPNLEKIDSGRVCPICGAHLYEQKAFGGMIIPMMCECELTKIKKEREEFKQRQFASRVNDKTDF